MPHTFARSLAVIEAATQDAPGQLARRYGRLVFQAAYRVLGDTAAAEDVQQEVFLRLLESRPDGVVTWPAYLATAANRAAIDQLRKRRRWWRVLPLWRAGQEDTAASAEQAGMERERAGQLRSALAVLPRREAQCFALRYLQGMEIAEIAAALSLNANNVNVILHRARRRLEARLGDATSELNA